MPPSLPEISSRWLGLPNADALAGRALRDDEGRACGGEWARAVPPGCIAAFLLLEGTATWSAGAGQPSNQNLAGRILWVHAGRGWKGEIVLTGAARHSALLLCYPVVWAREKLGDLGRELAPDWRALLLAGAGSGSGAVERPLEAEDRAWARGLMAPSLCPAARRLLEGSRMSEFFFRKVLLEARGQELFCTRTRRLALDRVERVRRALRADLENPPDLESLARLCGCNPHYLSRTFTETAGMTITHYLRQLRIDRAAELLSRGSHNASEAALEVGYQSMSHFSHAFRQVKGAAPRDWMRGRASNERQSAATRRQRPEPARRMAC